MSRRNKIDCLILCSSEDDKHLVLGGIGTYLGLLSREIKSLYPAISVYWVTRSPGKKDFIETDHKGVVRYYLSAESNYNLKPFYRLIQHKDSLDLVEKIVFNQKVASKIYEIINYNKGKNIVIESGEWEGLCSEVFKNISDPKIIKSVRLHTPLATCIKQNLLERSSSNTYQLIAEHSTIELADCVSACTNFAKSNVINDVLGKDNKKKIVTIPNPIDITNFFPNLCTRIESVKTLNSFIKSSFIKEDTFNILVVGSVENRKGVNYVMDAIPEICEKIPEARICFIGHCGNERSKNYNANTKLSPQKMFFRIQKKYWKFVKFSNYIDHKALPRVFGCGDLFPIMSLGDNFHGVVAEISLSAKPIIALMRGGVKEMLTNNNREIAYSIGKDLKGAANRLAVAVKYLYDKPDMRNDIGNNLRKLMLEKYHPETVTRDIVEFYNKQL